MLDSNETEQLGCFMSFTFSNFMLGLRVLYKARPIQTNSTISTNTTAWTWIFSAPGTATTNNAAPTVSAITACLCYVTFVDGFPPAALPDPLSRDVLLFQRKVRLSEVFDCCSLEEF